MVRSGVKYAGDQEKLILEVNRDIDAGIYTSWSQWPELLEDFPPHSTMLEGQEGHRDRANGDEDEDEDDDDGGDEDGGPGPPSGFGDEEDEEEDSEEEDADANDDDADSGVGLFGEAPLPSSSPAAASTAGPGSGVGESEPTADIADTEVKAVEKCLAIARASNFKVLIEQLTLQLKQLQKRQKIGGSVVAEHLRQLAQDRFEEFVIRGSVCGPGGRRGRYRAADGGRQSFGP